MSTKNLRLALENTEGGKMTITIPYAKDTLTAADIISAVEDLKVAQPWEPYIIDAVVGAELIVIEKTSYSV